MADTLDPRPGETGVHRGDDISPEVPPDVSELAKEYFRRFTTIPLDALGSLLPLDLFTSFLGRLTSEQVTAWHKSMAHQPIETRAAFEALRIIVKQRTIDSIGLTLGGMFNLFPTTNTDIRYISNLREQQAIVRNFLFENSFEFSDTKMVRSLPIFIYSQKVPDALTLKELSESFGFAQLDVLPPVFGSWFGKFVAYDKTPKTQAEFWDSHRRLDVATAICQRLGGFGWVIAAVGLTLAHANSPSPVHSTPTGGLLQEQTITKQVSQEIDLNQLRRYMTEITVASDAERGRKLLECLSSDREDCTP